MWVEAPKQCTLETFDVCGHLRPLDLICVTCSAALTQYLIMIIKLRKQGIYCIRTCHQIVALDLDPTFIGKQLLPDLEGRLIIQGRKQFHS